MARYRSRVPRRSTRGVLHEHASSSINRRSCKPVPSPDQMDRKLLTSSRLLCAAMLLISLCILPACTSSYLSNASHQGVQAGPQGQEEGPFRRQLWFVPSPDRDLLMAATVWRPKGPGPFPIAILNHASSQDPNDRVEDPTPRYEGVAQWLVRHGFAVVLPVRPGHGKTGGVYLEDQGDCENADYVKSGLASADSIQAALDYTRAQQFAKKDRVIIVGQSAGSWGALALASRNPPGFVRS